MIFNLLGEQLRHMIYDFPQNCKFRAKLPKYKIICFVEVESNYVMLDMLRMLPLCDNHVRTLVGNFREFYVKNSCVDGLCLQLNYAMNMLVDHIVIAYMSI